MGHVEKRNGRWRARYRSPDGRERNKTFDRKVDAQRFLASVETDKLRGSYIDPRAGKITFKRFAEQWLAGQTFNESTREAVQSRLRVHVYPTFGEAELRAVRPSMVQAWLRDRQSVAAPSSVRVLLANVSAIFAAAAEDGLIVGNPCASRSVKAPSIDRDRIVPWPRDQVAAVLEAMPDRYAGTVYAAAGVGLRQGEVFGLRVEDVDFLARRVLVRRQLKIVGGHLVLAPPKGGKSREVPLPDSVAFPLAEHLQRWPAVDVTLPGRPRQARRRRHG